MSNPNVNKQQSIFLVGNQATSVAALPCQHSEIYTCGPTINFYCGLCDSFSAITIRDLSAASNFACRKCSEVQSNNGYPIMVDGFSTARFWNDKGFMEVYNYYIPSKPKLIRQNAIENPPAPRLVGIELNPGPLATVKAYNKLLAKNNKNNNNNNNNKKVKRNRPKGQSTEIRTSRNLYIRHVHNVLNPINFAPVPHSIGTDEPVTQATFYRSGTGTMATDGSGFIELIPNNFLNTGTSATNSKGNLLCYNTATTAAAPALTSFSDGNATQHNATVPIFRVISAQLKVFPLTALTGVPGVVCGDLLRSTLGGNLTTDVNTTTTKNGYSGMKRFVNDGKGYFINWRPDIADITNPYRRYDVKYLTDENLGSRLYIGFSGFPASTTYLFEAVVHAEGYVTPTSTTNDAIPSMHYDRNPNLGELGIKNDETHSLPIGYSGGVSEERKYMPKPSPSPVSGGVVNNSIDFLTNTVPDIFEKYTGILNSVSNATNVLGKYFDLSF